LTRREFQILRHSPLYVSEPWGGAEGGDFVNAVLELRKRGSASDFLAELLAIETEFGRERIRRLAARTCDLDLLLWGDECVDLPELCVPHPHIPRRRFVLAPLCDLIPDALHPRMNRTFQELLRDCSDPLRVQPLQVPPTQ
jgi:2-amino-4-hydroxy-6-hydroxymethyldihydropteridine diphosphokinase